jgi:ribose transport system ATP-binding protein
MGICHRIIVFSDGRITGDLARDEFSEERILDRAFHGYLASGAAGPAAQPAAT